MTTRTLALAPSKDPKLLILSRCGRQKRRQASARPASQATKSFDHNVEKRVSPIEERFLWPYLLRQGSVSPRLSPPGSGRQILTPVAQLVSIVFELLSHMASCPCYIPLVAIRHGHLADVRFTRNTKKPHVFCPKLLIMLSSPASGQRIRITCASDQHSWN